MRTELFYVFCIKNSIETNDEDLLTVKVFSTCAPHPTPGVYATDRSKTVVLVLFLLCVALRFL